MKTKIIQPDPFMVTKVETMVEALGARERLAELAAGAKPKLGRWAKTQGLQQPSTNEKLAMQASRSPEEDEAYWNRPMLPVEAYRVERDAEKVFREKNRASIDDIARAEALRHIPRNQLGESKLSATTPEKRASAIHHFEVAGNVKPADIDYDKIVGLEPIKSEPPPQEVWVELPWYKAVWHWVKGGKVRSDKS